MLQDICPHDFLITYLPERKPEPNDYIVFYVERELFFRRTPEGLRFPFYRECTPAPENLRYLFSIDDIGYFWAPECLPEDKDNYEAVPAGNLRQSVAEKHYRFAGLTAWQLIRWHQENRFCSACGHPVEHDAKERMYFCPNCKRQIFPKISPALILAVYDGDRLLLSRYLNRKSDRPLGEDSALLAGFMEVGETPEVAAKREVMEEVGVKIKNLKFYKAQPWSLSDSLLLGFTAELDGDDTITLQEDELSAAGWVHRKDIVRSNDDFSLTNEMICAFKDGLLP